MKSLFLKMFLWFCGTTLAILIGISVGFLRDSPTALVTNWREFGQRTLVLAGRTAAGTYERGGSPALAAHLQNIARDLNMRAALLDSSGADLGDSGLAVEADEVRQLSSAPEQEFTIARRIGGLAGVRVRGPNGGAYLFVVALPPRGPEGWARAFLVSLLIVGAALCWFFAQYITAPVTHLRALTHRFSQGDLGARVTMPAVLERRDEIGQLARDFNQMAGRIESLMQAQRRLIGDVSHELRSPITRLSLAVGLMRQRGSHGDATSLARMTREVERLNALIEQLLTLSRLEHLDRPGPSESFDLGAVVREVVSDADFEAGSAGVSVRMTQCDEYMMHGSPDLVRSAIENVVRNAVRYTGPQTEVSVSLTRTSDGGAVTVRDHGPGVPEPELSHIFEPFYRVDAARDRHTGGAGLGLAITARIMKLHGGAVSAANVEPHGLEFRLFFTKGDSTHPNSTLP